MDVHNRGKVATSYSGGKEWRKPQTQTSRELGLESQSKGQLNISNMLLIFSIFSKEEQEFYFFLVTKAKLAKVNYKGF